MQQHPDDFEYNDYLLVTLARASQGGVSPFGDFLFNSERERDASRLRGRTASIWPWVLRHRGWFTNRAYVRPPGSVLLPRRRRRRRCRRGRGEKGDKEEEEEGEDEEEDPEGWRKDVLSVQTGGRFMTVWAEYYFDATPAWFPDPRHVFTEALEGLGLGLGGGGGGKSKEASVLVRGRKVEVGSGERDDGVVVVRSVGATTTATAPPMAQRYRCRIKDPWCASLFDPEFIQQLVFPGFAAQQQQQQQQHTIALGASAHAALQVSSIPSAFQTSCAPARVVIPPALALLKGPEMHAYYTLVQHLRTKRRAQVQSAFEAWRAWTAKRVAAKQAQDAGWGLVGDDEDVVEDMLRTPRLVVVAAKKGVEVEMDRIIQAGAFFGSGPVEFEEETEEEVDEEESGSEQEKEGDMCDIGVVSDEVDGFDDFGFPVE